MTDDQLDPKVDRFLELLVEKTKGDIYVQVNGPDWIILDGGVTSATLLEILEELDAEETPV